MQPLVFAGLAAYARAEVDVIDLSPVAAALFTLAVLPTDRDNGHRRRAAAGV